MKVRWNACYALGNTFRNHSLPLGEWTRQKKKKNFLQWLVVFSKEEITIIIIAYSWVKFGLNYIQGAVTNFPEIRMKKKNI